MQLFANLAFVWVVGNYFPVGEMDLSGRVRKWVAFLRALAVLAGCWMIAGGSGGWIVALPLMVASGVLSIARDRMPKRFLAEIETVNIVVLVGLGRVVNHLGVSLHPLIHVRLAENVVSAMLLIASIVCYSVRGGNYVVRGLLEKGALIPASSTTDVQVRHGRLIGYLERIVIIAAVSAGNFEALGFLIAAKGLIRAKEFDDRAFAEYFLVGSLCSVLVALVAGTMIHAIVLSIAPAGFGSMFH
jgi:hypothetical protein